MNNYTPMQIPDLNNNPSTISEVKTVLSSQVFNGLWAYADVEGLVSWNGISWSPVTQPEMTGVIHSMIDFNGEIFVYGQSSLEGHYVKRRNVSGSWYTFTNVSSSSNVGKFKIVDGKLYLIGINLSVNGINSNVLVYEEGINWKRLGTLTSPVADICSFKNQLYLASYGSIYVLNK